MTDSPPSHTEFDELYAAYCEFKNDATRALLSDESNSHRRENLQRLNRLMTKPEFCNRLLSLDPRRFEKVKTILANGWQNGRGQLLPGYLNEDHPRGK